MYGRRGRKKNRSQQKRYLVTITKAVCLSKPRAVKLTYDCTYITHIILFRNTKNTLFSTFNFNKICNGHGCVFPSKKARKLNLQLSFTWKKLRYLTNVFGGFSYCVQAPLTNKPERWFLLSRCLILANLHFLLPFYPWYLYQMVTHNTLRKWEV